MRVLSTKMHGILDYLTALFLILCPQLFDLSSSSPEGAVFVLLGILTLVYSAITQYELALFRVVPMDVHLVFDIFSGLFLAASPWLLDFSRYVPYCRGDRRLYIDGSFDACLFDILPHQ
ncbi:hypothetical protein ACK8HY_06120 [Sphingobacterium sp. NGMCC 1.201703]|uniref:SPW repeat domain-containing protein n=1 Tax=Sphingobacterium sp. NGMCC 1.201703 TaxID=3388657 RepID=UPI0039FC0B69